jgi:serine protease Do
MMAGLMLAAAMAPAHAIDPSQLFEKVAPSVWIVLTYDSAQRTASLGSAVVVAKERLVTNRHVIAKANVVLVRRANVMYEASVEYTDPTRDLCLLHVANFTAPAVARRSVRDLKVGERVYAIGNPKGLEVTLSEGLISGLRSKADAADAGDETLVQTSAPISPGSSGGGLFDAEGRLIGITTFGLRDAQNLNVALPTDWIAQIPERVKTATAKRDAAKAALAAQAGTAPPGYPAPGTVWVYGFKDRIFSRQAIDVTIRSVRVDDGMVEEAVTADSPDARDVQRTVSARESRFVDYALSKSNILVELAPYLVAANEGKVPAELGKPKGYPLGGAGLPGWATSASIVDQEQVTVPAGSFRASHVHVKGKRTGPVNPRVAESSEFTLDIWYAPEVKRYVRIDHRVWSKGAFDNNLIVHDVVELLSYRSPY